MERRQGQLRRACSALATRTTVVAMITMFDDEAGRSRSHGLRPEVLDAQAERLGLRAESPAGARGGPTTPHFPARCEQAAADGITHVIFGDIMFDEHRQWAERICGAAGLTAVEPLWGESTDALFDAWVSSGERGGDRDGARRAPGRDVARPDAVVAEMLAELRQLGVDACGERGEYHTARHQHAAVQQAAALAKRGTRAAVRMLGARRRQRSHP